MRKWMLCVPTYNRKEPKVLEMAKKDPYLEVNLFVRQEFIDSGFYNHLKGIKNVILRSLGYGVTCIGDTRQRIINFCVRNDIKYCAMFDDGICNFVEDEPFYEYCRPTISQTFEKVIDIMENDPLSDRMVGFGFIKRLSYYADGHVARYDDSHLIENDYFMFAPFQTAIWNIELIKKHNLRFHTLQDVGFEDCAFFADCLKAGLVFGSRKWLKVDGVVPNETKAGGNHTLAENIEHKYDAQVKKCMQYIGNMYGVYIDKRYRSYAKGLLGFIVFDLNYFREVLVYKPERNKEIIERGFQYDV